MATVSRVTLGWALFLAIPPGVAVTGFVTRVDGRGLVSPTGALAGVITAAVVFGLVLAASTWGSPDRSRR